MVVVSHPSPCLCLDSIPKTNMSVKNGINGEVLFMERRASMKRKQLYVKPQRSMELTSGFVNSWYDSRLISKPISLNVGKCSRTHRKSKRLVDELGGQYEDGFEDVKTQLVNYFTYKAVRTVLNQLYEMNPPHYTWFYNFVVANKPADSKRFMRTLTKENQDLAERVMVTRLHLYGKWVKKCNHDEIYKEISDQNVELMRERLMETVIWPSDDTNTERIG